MDCGGVVLAVCSGSAPHLFCSHSWEVFSGMGYGISWRFSSSFVFERAVGGRVGSLYQSRMENTIFLCELRWCYEEKLSVTGLYIYIDATNLFTICVYLLFILQTTHPLYRKNFFLANKHTITKIHPCTLANPPFPLALVS